MTWSYDGVFTALATPFDGQGRVDLTSWDRLIASQLEAGVQGLVVAGTTGEGGALSADELRQLVARAKQLGGDRVPVVAGVTSPVTAKAMARARIVEEAGADALLCAAPPYVKPTQDGMVAHFGKITTASNLPLVVYNVPGRTVSDILPGTLAQLANDDAVVAIKDATADMLRAAETLERVEGRASMLSGDDFTVLPFMALGGRGVISVVSNLVPGRMVALCRAMHNGDLSTARALQFELLELTRWLFAEANPIPVKAALKQLGIFENDTPRLPLTPAVQRTRDGLHEALVGLGRLRP